MQIYLRQKIVPIINTESSLNISCILVQYQAVLRHNFFTDFAELSGAFAKESYQLSSETQADYKIFANHSQTKKRQNAWIPNGHPS